MNFLSEPHFCLVCGGRLVTYQDHLSPTSEQSERHWDFNEAYRNVLTLCDDLDQYDFRKPVTWRFAWPT